jgi:hypothetical protein
MGDALFVGGHSLSLARRGEGGVADAVGSRLAAHLPRGARAIGEDLTQPDASQMDTSPFSADCAWRSWVADQGLSPSQTTRTTPLPD